MNETTTIGLDIAKQVFQVHGVDVDSTVTVKRQLRRSEVIRFFDRLPRCRVGLEACGGAHFWARELTALGHDVRLIPACWHKNFDGFIVIADGTGVERTLHAGVHIRRLCGLPDGVTGGVGHAPRSVQLAAYRVSNAGHHRTSDLPARHGAKDSSVGIHA
jgi:hypothetical protein